MLREQAEQSTLTSQQIKAKRLKAEALERKQIAEDAASQTQDKYNTVNAQRNRASNKRRLMESKAIWDKIEADRVAMEATKKADHAREKRHEADTKSSKAKSDNAVSQGAVSVTKDARTAIEEATIQWRTTEAKQKGLKTKIKSITREARKRRARESLTAPSRTRRSRLKSRVTLYHAQDVDRSDCAQHRRRRSSRQEPHLWTHEIKATKLAKITAKWEREIARLTESRNGWNKKWSEKKREEAISRNSTLEENRKRDQVFAARARDRQATADLKRKILERDIRRSMLSIGHSKHRIRTAKRYIDKAKKNKENENLQKDKAMTEIQKAKQAINNGAFQAWKARNRRTRAEYNCRVARMGRQLSENLVLLKAQDTKTLKDKLNFKLKGKRYAV